MSTTSSSRGAEEDLPPFDREHVLKHTQSPNPSWTYGQKLSETDKGKAWLAGEKEGWTVFDPEKEGSRQTYLLLISGVIPRPIAFVSSISETGVYNLAPFSWFNTVSSNPPTIVIGCTNLPTRIHDTALNIIATKQFTVNLISETFIENANFTAVDTPIDHSEWPASGLTMADSVYVKPPRVRESVFSLECELSHQVDLSPAGSSRATSTVLFGLVKRIHVRNDVLNEKGVVNPALYRPVARLGDISYTTLGDAFRLPRLAWADVGSDVVEAEEAIRI
ncbi:hypothetical protein Clacol_007744 [Clathrus columnatus]|uniref:Flavin reductase like domain-containing protein n=1 Tax=Clathrus columnatus TaxID=1419009 RepID=A0AAV5AKU3_9AGAM|nr:hypothetical protein Clacol_007744 [Clathrus columnatus]